MVNVIHIFPVNDIWRHKLINGCVLCECNPKITDHGDRFVVAHDAIDIKGVVDWMALVPEELQP